MTTTQHKNCSKCGLLKRLDEFNRDRSLKTGRNSACKHCQSLKNKAQYHNRICSVEVIQDGSKTCTKCKVERPISDFALSRGMKGGRQSRCKNCYNITYNNMIGPRWPRGRRRPAPNPTDGG